MNAKMCKRISSRADTILLDWLKGLIPEEDHDKINKNNFKEYLPDEIYFYVNKTLWWRFYSPKWTRKLLKKMIKLGADLDSITIKDLEWMRKQSVQRNEQ